MQIGNCLSLSYIITVYFYTTFANGMEEDLGFPNGFLIGTGTSAYQVEGAWNASDKGESAWDRFTHTRPEKIADRSNGDIACDSYHRYKEDVQLLKQIGVDFYRFSISWTRLLPTGYANVVSKDGLNYYNNLIDELLKNNIIPVLTLYHWDHPQVFEDMGGWSNEIMVDFFGDYARVIFREFGDRVKMFTTINEPKNVCNQRFDKGPELVKYAVYQCHSNILKAHARAYHIYDDEFRTHQKGKVGIALGIHHHYSKQKDDKVSDDVAFQFHLGIHAHPIFSKEGDWPDVVKQRIEENSKYEGFSRSRLPTFSKYWIDYIRGTSDYLGVNHYTSYYVEPAPKDNGTVYPNDDGLLYSTDEKWPSTHMSQLKVVPEGFKATLLKIKEEYGNPSVYVLENGLSDSGTLEDHQRLEYLYSYMKAMLSAIKEHGCDVRAYAVWSLMDNFEWAHGYTEKFGIFKVDFTSPNMTRTPKKSVFWLKNVIRTRKLQPIDRENN